jgi:hypothetical protein
MRQAVVHGGSDVLCSRRTQGLGRSSVKRLAPHETQPRSPSGSDIRTPRPLMPDNCCRTTHRPESATSERGLSHAPLLTHPNHISRCDRAWARGAETSDRLSLLRRRRTMGPFGAGASPSSCPARDPPYDTLLPSWLERPRAQRYTCTAHHPCQPEKCASAAKTAVRRRRKGGRT